MQNLSKYIIELLNINTESSFVLADIDAELRKIKHLDTYRHYIRDNLNHIDLEYKTGFQKFILLTNKYLKIEERAEAPTDKAKTFAKQLADKFKVARSTIISLNNIGQKNPISSLGIDGVKYFTDKEVTALASLGGVATIIEYSEIGMLENEVMEFFIGKFIAKSKHESLTSGQQRIQKLIKKQG